MAQTTQDRDPREVRRQADRERREDAARAVDERARQTAMAVGAAEQRMARSQPTPTQRENDLAKVGALDIDDKEDDGSGPDPSAVPVTTRQMSPAAGPAYSTRAAAPAAGASAPASTPPGGQASRDEKK